MKVINLNPQEFLERFDDYKTVTFEGDDVVELYYNFADKHYQTSVPRRSLEEWEGKRSVSKTDLFALAELSKEYAKLYGTTGLAGIGDRRVLMAEDEFLAVFKEYEIEDFTGDLLKLKAYHDDVEFAALCKAENLTPNRLDKEVISKIADLQKAYAEIYNRTGLAGLYQNKIQLSFEEFTETFHSWKVADRESDECPHELSTEMFGAIFFTIASDDEMKGIEQ